METGWKSNGGCSKYWHFYSYPHLNSVTTTTTTTAAAAQGAAAFVLLSFNFPNTSGECLNFLNMWHVAMHTAIHNTDICVLCVCICVCVLIFFFSFWIAWEHAHLMCLLIQKYFTFAALKDLESFFWWILATLTNVVWVCVCFAFSSVRPSVYECRFCNSRSIAFYAHPVSSIALICRMWEISIRID